MNGDMKQKQLARLKHAEARDLYETLCAVCEKRSGGMDDIAQNIVGDIAMMEEQKLLFDADVATRGVMVSWRNGRQTGMRENKSIQQARMLREQQRKHLHELRLTPASLKGQEESPGETEAQRKPEDEFDDFPDA